MILQACLFRESSSKPLCFERSDYPQMDPESDKCFITIRQENGKAVKGRVPLGYFGDVEEEYENGTRIILAADYGRRRSEHGKGTDGFRSALQCKAAEV